MMRTFRLGVLALGLVACGGDDQDGGTTIVVPAAEGGGGGPGGVLGGMGGRVGTGGESGEVRVVRETKSGLRAQVAKPGEPAAMVVERAAMVMERAAALMERAGKRPAVKVEHASPSVQVAPAGLTGVAENAAPGVATMCVSRASASPGNVRRGRSSVMVNALICSAISIIAAHAICAVPSCQAH